MFPPHVIFMTWHMEQGTDSQISTSGNDRFVTVLQETAYYKL